MLTVVHTLSSLLLTVVHISPLLLTVVNSLSPRDAGRSNTPRDAGRSNTPRGTTVRSTHIQRYNGEKYTHREHKARYNTPGSIKRSITHPGDTREERVLYTQEIPERRECYTPRDA